MVVTKNPEGLFEVDVRVKGRKKDKVLKGLVDTGSTDCATTYKLITTLQIKPIDWRRVNQVTTQGRCLVYEVGLGFDGQSVKVPIIRVQKIIGGKDLIIGMSVLSHCKLTFEGDRLTIDWPTPQQNPEDSQGTTEI